MSSTELQ